MRRFIILLFGLTIWLSGCSSFSKATPSATQALETLALPPTWTNTPTIAPSATTSPSPPTATAVDARPSSTPSPWLEPIRFHCPPAGELTELARIAAPINAINLEISGNHAYIVHNTGLWIFDIADPSQPIEAGFKAAHGSTQMIISEPYGYGLDSDGLWKLDLSNPVTPTFMGYKDTPDLPMELAISQNHAFIRDNYGNLRAFDLSEDGNFQEVGVYDSPGEASGGDISGNLISTTIDLARKNPFHSFSIREGYAFIADLDAGLRIVDISDPTRLREVEFFNLSQNVSDVEVIRDTVLIFGINLGTDLLWDLWVQDISDLIRGEQPVYLGAISIPQASKTEILCPFISKFLPLISGSQFEDAFAEIPPGEILDIFKGVNFVGDLIYVADERRGLVTLQFTPSEE